MPSITLKLKNKSLGDYKLRNGISMTIGRRENNDVVIEDPAVSGHHAKIDSLGDRYVLIDLQSKNGSFVNEQLINSHWLKHGDVVNIGRHSLVFNHCAGEPKINNDSDEFDTTQVMNTTQHRRMMIKSNPSKSINVVRFWDKDQNRSKVKDNVPKVSGPISDGNNSQKVGVLTYLAGGSGSIKLMRKITTIGKHPASDIVVKGLMMDQTAATINKRSDGFYLDYVGGLPRPKVNDKTVTQSTILHDLDIIDIGTARLQFSN
jgi:pSer/pThr/pTyr-binding forkhead associated (FHA) protein